MKVKIKLGKFAIALLLVGGVSGCDDFMEYQPYSAGDTSTFWKTEADLRSALNAFYAFANAEECSGRGHYWYENCSDNMITGRVNVTADRIRNFQMGTNESYVESKWNHMFGLISKCNGILLNAPNMPVSASMRDNALGQAYFFRAFAYLWICPWYADNNNGGLPWMHENVKAEDLDQPRLAKVTDNYNHVIDDFLKAVKLLPNYSELNGPDRSRPHKTAAMAFCARAALYAAQYGPGGNNPGNDGSVYHKYHTDLTGLKDLTGFEDGFPDGTNYFDIVIKMCDGVINLGGADARALHYLAAGHNFDDPLTNSVGLRASNFSDLFRVENNYSSEFIYSLIGHGSGYGPKFHGMSFHNTGFGGYNTWGYYHPTAELYEAFEGGDTRRDATIMAPGQSIVHPTNTGSFEGRVIRLGVPGDIGDVKDIPTGLLNRKMHAAYEKEGGWGVDFATSGDGLQNSLGQVLIRYADILLMKAEALIWTKGEGDSEARGLINQVRVRAGLPANSEATKAQLQNERRVEFAFEFLPCRHVDLVRWGLAQAMYSQPVHGYDVKFTNGVDGPYTFDPSGRKQVWNARTFNPVKNNVFPIHQNVINRSNVLKQNAGY